jgi:hypothetical protein
MEFDSTSHLRIQQSISLMDDFAVRTGLDSDRPARRYLWTDAFAVCNYLGLARRTSDQHYRDLALRRVSQIHLGIGGLLVDAYRAAQLKHLGAPIEDHLVAKPLAAALVGLGYYAANGELQAAAEYRLAFRELGLAIGLEAAERLSRYTGQEESTAGEEISRELKAPSRYSP